MKKSDLKTGMLVQFRDDSIFMVLTDCLISTTNCLFLKYYTDDLLRKGANESKYDIMKISRQLSYNNLSVRHWTVGTLENYLWKTRGGEDIPVKTLKLRGKSFNIEANKWE